MNISLTVLFVIAFALAMTCTWLAISDGFQHEGSISAIVAALVLGFCITHGQYYEATWAWMMHYVGGDGLAGEVVSGAVAFVAEMLVASLPIISTAALYFLGAAKNGLPLFMGIKQTRRGKVISFLRSYRSK
jgi:hypothetical protein